MANPLLSKRRSIGVKAEATAGTAESLTAAECAYNVYDFDLAPTIDSQERPGQGSGLSPGASVMGAASGTSKFKLDLFGGASVPASLTTFLTACGLKLTSSTFTPESRPPEAASSGAKTITIGGFVDGLKRLLYGAMGNAVLHFPAGRVCYADYTFMGCWGDPSDVALPAPTPTTVAPLKFISSSLVVGAVGLKVGELTVDLGNQVVLREDPAAASGYRSAIVSGRKITLSMDMEAALVATYDPHAAWKARTEEQIAWTIGAAGNQLAFAFPKCQVINVQPGSRNGIEIFNVTYQANAVDLTAAPGDDEFSIVVA
jgi:hypothetical protein